MQDNPLLNNGAEDHLKNFIQTPNNNHQEPQNKNIEHFGPNSKEKVEYIQSTADSNFIEIPLKDLPHGKFYTIGTRISIRPVTTKEIESFAVVNENNRYDVQLKLNEVLSACVKISFLNGTFGTYKDIQDGDRETLAIILAKVSAKNGRKIEKSVICDCNKEQQLIELIPANYKYKVEDEAIAPFFNQDTRCYDLEMQNGTTISIKPPTIGLTEDINNYIFVQTTKSEGKIAPNITFLQTIPYIKAGQNVKSLSIEKLEQEEFNFSKMDPELFMFVYDAIDLISFGIEEVKKTCKFNCGKEISTKFTFPRGARALFIVPNAFKQFTR